MLTRQDLETALDQGRLYGVMSNGREWKLRRNGQTKTWKTRPNDFRIPVKAGLRSCAAIDQTNANSGNWVIR